MSKINIPYISLATHGTHVTLESTVDYLLAISTASVKPDHNVIAKKVWELVRFLFIRAVYGEDVSPSSAIDELWHSVILETTLYQDLCRLVIQELESDDLCGVDNNIISHSQFASLDSSDDKDKRYNKTREIYIKTYNDVIYPAVWTDTRVPIVPMSLGSMDGC